ncbi:MAG: PEP-CTERM sorting domain-containing protein [Methylibium sp.]|uniref:PEP-CTERM sorting domain-containing protein n=1 Tax=Methylibium sp. TaxID=2067992 RepID=UPI0018062A48|nr:PEP-CTERM sorting domain-containing protein [Methylibium sp.]MBA3596441.1 PEP-CTERM sorting domain-containing protein [Methylibium sp.]
MPRTFVARLAATAAVAAITSGFGSASAALIPGHASYSVVFSDLKLDLVDLDLTDNLTPQVTTTAEEFESYYTGDLGDFKLLTGFLGPKTEVVISYTTEITLQALDYPGSFVYFSYDALVYVEGVGYQGSSGEADSLSVFHPNSPYTGEPVLKNYSFSYTFNLTNGIDYDVPTFVPFTLAAGPISELFSDGEANSPIPEPSTYALMLMGLGAVGLHVRRRMRRVR